MNAAGGKGKGRILFISKRRDAASTRYRIFQYWDYLQDFGWQCDYLPVSAGRLQLLRSAAAADIVVVQRKLFDALTLRLLKLCNSNLVFDYDDAIFLNDDGSASPRRQARFAQSTALARLAFAGNSYLAEHSRSEETWIIPTTVELSRYPRAQEPSPAEPLTLVWIGSRSTRKYLEQFRDSLEAMGRAFPASKLKVIGDFDIAFDSLQTECIAWSAEREVAELSSAHVGIAPMSDDPWTRGKCALKVIQYMACGLPVISSDCGANAEIVVEGETGFLVPDSEGWVAALGKLQDAALRRRMGEAARRQVEDHYSAQSQARVMDELFTGLRS